MYRFSTSGNFFLHRRTRFPKPSILNPQFLDFDPFHCNMTVGYLPLQHNRRISWESLHLPHFRTRTQNPQFPRSAHTPQTKIPFSTSPYRNVNAKLQITEESIHKDLRKQARSILRRQKCARDADGEIGPDSSVFARFLSLGGKGILVVPG